MQVLHVFVRAGPPEAVQEVLADLKSGYLVRCYRCQKYSLIDRQQDIELVWSFRLKLKLSHAICVKLCTQFALCITVTYSVLRKYC